MGSLFSDLSPNIVRKKQEKKENLRKSKTLYRRSTELSNQIDNHYCFDYDSLAASCTVAWLPSYEKIVY